MTTYYVVDGDPDSPKIDENGIMVGSVLQKISGNKKVQNKGGKVTFKPETKADIEAYVKERNFYNPRILTEAKYKKEYSQYFSSAYLVNGTVSAKGVKEINDHLISEFDADLYAKRMKDFRGIDVDPKKVKYIDIGLRDFNNEPVSIKDVLK